MKLYTVVWEDEWQSDKSLAWCGTSKEQALSFAHTSHNTCKSVSWYVCEWDNNSENAQVILYLAYVDRSLRGE